MTRKQNSSKEEIWKEALINAVKEENFLRPLVEQMVQQILEAEMDELRAAVSSGYARGYRFGRFKTYTG